MRLMDTPTTVTGPVNLGNPGEFTMLELAEKVHRASPARARKIVFRAAAAGRPAPAPARHLLCPAGARAGHPVINLDAGLRRTIPYFERLIASLPPGMLIEHAERLNVGVDAAANRA